MCSDWPLRLYPEELAAHAQGGVLTTWATRGRRATPWYTAHDGPGVGRDARHSGTASKPAVRGSAIFIVVVRRRARPRQVSAVLRRFRDQLGLLSQSTGRVGAAIFQQLDDPRGFLYLGEWTSQAAFESAAAAVRRPEAEAVLFESEPQVYCCKVLRPLGGSLSHAAAVRCTIIEGPDAAAESLLRTLSAAGPAGPGVPQGMIGYALYQDLALPGRIILIHGWLAAADLEAVQRSRALQVIAVLQGLGASVTYFAARSQVVLGATLDLA